MRRARSRTTRSSSAGRAGSFSLPWIRREQVSPVEDAECGVVGVLDVRQRFDIRRPGPIPDAVVGRPRPCLVDGGELLAYCGDVRCHLGGVAEIACPGGIVGREAAPATP